MASCPSVAARVSVRTSERLDPAGAMEMSKAIFTQSGLAECREVEQIRLLGVSFAHGHPALVASGS